MTRLVEVLDLIHLQQMIDEGYVRVQSHPSLPYRIACYTKKAMFDREWNDTTSICRGLVWDVVTGEILARPFKKFFNHGEPNAPVFGLEDWVTVYDKVDGSLGIAYDTPDGPAIATKGSFASDQALHATELLRAKYPRYQTDDYCTDLFEIIYPDNRIVLDYGDADELRYLGSVVVETGEDYWNGILIGYYDIPKNHFLVSGEFGQVIPEIDLHRPNAEGVVILNHDTGDRLKMKQEDYIELHRVMTGLNERQIWEWLREKSLDEILVDLPEELHAWATQVSADLTNKFDELALQVIDAYYQSKHLARKEFALAHADKSPVVKGALFARYDNNVERASEIIWKAVRP